MRQQCGSEQIRATVLPVLLLLPQVAAGKRMQLQLEDAILQLLGSASGSLLDNLELLAALDASKATWQEVNDSLAVAEATAADIEAAAAVYRPSSARAAMLYFVLHDLAGVRALLTCIACAVSCKLNAFVLARQLHALLRARAFNALPTSACHCPPCTTAIDHMYQYSLDAYTSLFLASIASAPKPESVAERIRALNDTHTLAVYHHASRGLFGRHKLLLSLAMCARIQAAAAQLNSDEWQLLLRGGQVRACQCTCIRRHDVPRLACMLACNSH